MEEHAVALGWRGPTFLFLDFAGHVMLYMPVWLTCGVASAAEPAALVRDTAMLLRPGGDLIISDLCPHDQAWAREHCGDLWLGFSPEDLRAWASAAGLKHCAELFLAQRNGFQIQVHHFKRC